MVQLSLQIVYFSLHGSLIVLFLRHMAPNLFWLWGPVVILSLKHVTTRARIALAGLSGVYASLSKPSILFISITFGVRESYPIAGIWLVRADGSLLDEGLILPCQIVVLTNTQVLPTDGANYRGWV